MIDLLVDPIPWYLYAMSAIVENSITFVCNIIEQPVETI
jgi:hypothetical protein